MKVVYHCRTADSFFPLFSSVEMIFTIFLSILQYNYSFYTLLNSFIRKLIDQDNAIKLIFEKLPPELWDIQVNRIYRHFRDFDRKQIHSNIHYLINFNTVFNKRTTFCLKFSQFISSHFFVFLFFYMILHTHTHIHTCTLARTQ